MQAMPSLAMLHSGPTKIQTVMVTTPPVLHPMHAQPNPELQLKTDLGASMLILMATAMQETLSLMMLHNGLNRILKGIQKTQLIQKLQIPMGQTLQKLKILMSQTTQRIKTVAELAARTIMLNRIMLLPMTGKRG